jgi:2-amino-4-hydroxy-6-hydroxymethyldihydropteridine diphosphokinase
MKQVEPVFIALGTNIGDRAGNLQSAKEAMAPRVSVVRESSVYITPPWGYTDQPDFYNQVIEVCTRLAPVPLLRYLKAIEKQMGRVTLFRNGPRVIDLDILFYGERVVDVGDLQIPHPRMAGRAFVLVPLVELAPNLVHPVLEMPVSEMLQDVDTSGVTRL